MASCRKCGTDEIDLICEDCRIYWRKVEDRLPEGKPSKEVLVYSDCGIGISFITSNGNWWQDEELQFDVQLTHWMPLPSPPSEREVVQPSDSVVK